MVDIIRDPAKLMLLKLTDSDLYQSMTQIYPRARDGHTTRVIQRDCSFVGLIPVDNDGVVLNHGRADPFTFNEESFLSVFLMFRNRERAHEYIAPEQREPYLHPWCVVVRSVGRDATYRHLNQPRARKWLRSEPTWHIVSFGYDRRIWNGND